jgi:hypothetical protein
MVLPTIPRTSVARRSMHWSRVSVWCCRFGVVGCAEIRPASNPQGSPDRQAGEVAPGIIESDSTALKFSRGLRMFGWFKKREQPARIARRIASHRSLELIERNDAPPGETEKMVSIQQLCWLAGISAETIAHAKAEGRLEEEWAKYDLDRYKQFRAECIELADTITDEFYRAVVINYLVELCMKAADVDDARALIKHQEIKSFREDIVAKYPELAQPRISEIMLSGQSPRFRRAVAVHARTPLRPFS